MSMIRLPKLAFAGVGLAIAVYERGPPDVGADGAFVDCPCIDHLDLAGGNSSWSLLVAGRVEGGRLQPVGARNPVPRNYGSSYCKAWDSHGSGLTECEALTAPSYCLKDWCFVDPNVCSKRRRPWRSEMFPGLYYSYTACGQHNDYLMNPPMPIIVYNFDYELKPVMTQGAPLFRAMSVFAYHTLGRMRVPAHGLVHRRLSNASRERFGSTYTACVYDLALGHLDLCVGDFWDTPQRRSFQAGFSTTIYSEYVYLYASLQTVDLSFWDMLYQPIRPFTFGLWALISAVMVASGLALALFEFHQPEGDFKDTGVVEAAPLSVYLSLLSFVNAGLSCNPQTTSGKIFALGLGFFICITIASFTANTASFLIYEAQTTQFSSLEDALEKGMTVCSYQALEEVVLQSFPALAQQGVFVANWEDSLVLLDRGDCNALLVPELAVIDAQSKGERCELKLLGRPVVAFPVGMYVSDRIQHHFNWAASDKRADGTWTMLEARIFPKSKCGARGADAVDENGPAQLKVHHMYGNCFLLLLCFCTSLVTHFCGRIEKSEAVQRAEQQTMASIQRLSGTAEARAEDIAQEVENRVHELVCESLHVSSALRGGGPEETAAKELERRLQELAHERLHVSSAVTGVGSEEIESKETMSL